MNENTEYIDTITEQIELFEAGEIQDLEVLSCSADNSVRLEVLIRYFSFGAFPVCGVVKVLFHSKEDIPTAHLCIYTNLIEFAQFLQYMKLLDQHEVHQVYPELCKLFPKQSSSVYMKVCAPRAWQNLCVLRCELSSTKAYGVSGTSCSYAYVSEALPSLIIETVQAICTTFEDGSAEVVFIFKDGFTTKVDYENVVQQKTASIAYLKREYIFELKEERALGTSVSVLKLLRTTKRKSIYEK